MKTLLPSILVLGLVFNSLALLAQNNYNVNVDKKNLAVQGYDLVAYFEDHKPVKGSEEFTFKYETATYHFASKAHLNTFKKNPEKYLPEYGGFCAYGVSRGYAVGVDPDAWSIVDGKLYLNYSLKVQKTWSEDKPGYIKKADQNWPTVGKN
ncbi:YHS domain-containing (seleno)protein [Haliscomenobacter hydrossis]|uniref:YHS domain-containing protein n=1 Tax=Haliscomenobacter hydrossis (strain ATCC 27775 / DSM 1100 / LMG 10767 / O) TaxID=760192 RepID=F4L5A3_HALH1|nr:YHS domain-containing (seleno)protein [Haliscomenobacter hydrossis]AEE49783.1 YHS domain-containing protein [Haliscomenobacter hydrossis DSM 1100]